MKKLIILSLLFVFSITNQANAMQTDAQRVKDYPAQKITNNVYVIHGPRANPTVANKGFMNNPLFIVQKSGVVVIDPGSSLYAGRMVIRQIEKITKAPITHVFNTHVHGDHWLGNHAIVEKWPNAKIYGHPNMIKKAKQGEAENWINVMETATEGLTKGTKAIIPKNSTNDNAVYKLHGLTYKIYAPQKAHSNTDIMIELVEDSVVILGDNVTYKRIGRMDDGTYKGSFIAFDIALNLNAKYYVPGHGPTGGKEVVKAFEHYTKTIYSKTEEYMDEDLQAYEMKPKIMAELSEYKSWAGFEEALGKWISLAVLEIEADF